MPRRKRDRTDVLLERLTSGTKLSADEALAAGREFLALDDDVDTLHVCGREIEARHPLVALEFYEAIVASKPESLATLTALADSLRCCRALGDRARAARLLPRAITLAQNPYWYLREQLEALRNDPAFTSLFDG